MGVLLPTCARGGDNGIKYPDLSGNVGRNSPSELEAIEERLSAVENALVHQADRLQGLVSRAFGPGNPSAPAATPYDAPPPRGGAIGAIEKRLYAIEGDLSVLSDLVSVIVALA